MDEEKTLEEYLEIDEQAATLSEIIIEGFILLSSSKKKYKHNNEAYFDMLMNRNSINYTFLFLMQTSIKKLKVPPELKNLCSCVVFSWV